MKAKTLAALVSASVLALTLAGCSSPSEAPEQQNEPAEAQAQAELQPQDLVIDESGYYLDEFGSAHYAAVISNPNNTWAAQNLCLTVTSKDDAGNIIGTTDAYTTLLFANGKTAICGTTFDAQSPASLEFSVSLNSNGWVSEDMPQSELDEVYFIQNLNTVAGDYGQFTVTGEVVNNSDGTYGSPAANIVLRGADGSIVGGLQGYVGSSAELAAHTTTPFSIDSYSVPEHATVEAYLDCGYPVTE